MIKEFRDFLFRGNIIDLAVAVVLGAAFGAIVTSLVEDILTPMLGLLGIPDFSTWVITVGDAEMRIGAFLNTLISFVLIAAAIFFVVVKPFQRIAAMRARPDEETAPSEVDLLTQIRDELRVELRGRLRNVARVSRGERGPVVVTRLRRPLRLTPRLRPRPP